MKILVACEFSGIVRDAFLEMGHYAVSCDLLPTEMPGSHIQGDILDNLEYWDMMIAHPPCTYLSVAGVQYLHKIPGRKKHLKNAIKFFNKLLNAPIEKIAIENPVQHRFAREGIRMYDQRVQMNWFGENACKPTCLWLKGLPALEKTKLVDYDSVRYPNGKTASKWYGKNRDPHKRSKTFKGFADAMAKQWGSIS